MYDVVALGEYLIDFTPAGFDANQHPKYIANPGGAPANVVVSLAQLGWKTSLIASVGRDSFGVQLKETLQEKNVDPSGLVHTDLHTTLAFVHLDESGERSFSFCRNPGADLMLQKEEIDFSLVDQTKIFHVGSVSMTNHPARETTIEAVDYALNQGKMISFDPNLRPLLWKDLEEAKRQMEIVLEKAHIVKVSEEELEFLTGIKEIEKAASKLIETHALQWLFVTVGEKGSYLFNQGRFVFSPGISVEAVDTTGCGDAFMGGVLHKILKNNYLEVEATKKEMKDLLRFGNAMGAYVAQYKGGIPAMPNLIEIETFMKQDV